MTRFFFAAFLSLVSAFAVRAATENEIRAQQTLGRVVTAPDGSFFLYEWMRPYQWTPDAEGLAPAVAARPQTWLYKVGTDPGTPSYYLFHPGPRSTYYLGDLSPDQQRVSFYEVDRTENTIKAGVLTFDHPAYPTITWFDAPPASEDLDEPAMWLSNDELGYRAKSGFVRGKLPALRKRNAEAQAANVDPDDRIARTSPCADCEARARARRKAAEASKAAEIPKGAKLLARSANGELSVYAVDTPEALTLLYKKGDTVRTLFENDRKPNGWAHDR